MTRQGEQKLQETISAIVLIFQHQHVFVRTERTSPERGLCMREACLRDQSTAEWAALCRELRGLCIPLNSPSWNTQEIDHQLQESRKHQCDLKYLDMC